MNILYAVCFLFLFSFNISDYTQTAAVSCGNTQRVVFREPHISVPFLEGRTHLLEIAIS